MVTLPPRRDPEYTDRIGWQFLLGAVLIVLGFVLLALVDAPRRAAHQLERLGWRTPRWWPVGRGRVGRGGTTTPTSPPPPPSAAEPVGTSEGPTAPVHPVSAPGPGGEARRALSAPATAPSPAPPPADRVAPDPSAGRTPRAQPGDLWVSDRVDGR